MKLICCKKCSHVFSLAVKVWRVCDCGRCGGRYLDDCLNAEIFGRATCLPLGFSNPSFIEAIRNQPEDDWGKNFTAFIIPKKCSTIRYRRRPRKPLSP